MWLSSLTRQQREALLGLAHNVVVSDGLLDPNEEGMLDEFKREMDLNPKTESQYLELHGVDKVFDTRRARIALLNLLRLSYVDGAFRDRGRVPSEGNRSGFRTTRCRVSADGRLGLVAWLRSRKKRARFM